MMKGPFHQLIWQYGDRDYRAKKWTNAADWYIAGSHQVFRSTRPESSSKCLRKAALCYMEQREFAKATSVIRRCPTNEATTHYIVLLIAVHQGACIIIRPSDRPCCLCIIPGL